MDKECRHLLDEYFNRVQYQGPADISESTLKDLHCAHTLNIPFENLDVFYQRTIHLDIASLLAKLVTNRRGGYCFEMNGLFSFVLKSLGFEVTDLLARVFSGDPPTLTAKTHQLSVININGQKWMADVGFGNDGIVAPIRLEPGIDQSHFNRIYRLEKCPDQSFILQKKEAGNYRNLYLFTMEPCLPIDFLMSNHFTSTHPVSFFTQMKFCTTPTRQGRITLTDRQLTIVAGDETTQTEINDDALFAQMLSQYFSLDLTQIKGDAQGR